MGNIRDQRDTKPVFEMLEPRLLLDGTSYLVNSLTDVVADDGVVTLREAIEAANTNTAVTSDVQPGSGIEVDTITFDQAALSLEAGVAVGDPLTITLGGTQLEIIDALDIQGLGVDVLTIDAAGASRVMLINDGSAATVKTVTLSGLTVSGGYVGGEGGGLHNSESTTLSEVTVEGNTAVYVGHNGGGGIFNTNTGDLRIIKSTVSGNTVDYDGGGIFSYGDLYIAESTISNNSVLQSGWYGGGGIQVSGECDIINSVFEGNSALGTGGAITSRSIMLTVVNSIIVGNSASTGGGIHSTSGTVTLTNSTVSGNSASNPFVGSGGGIYNGSGALTLNNTIVALNDATTSASIYGSVTSHSSLVGVDPGFVRNPSPGADGVWGTDDDDYGDLRLTAGSLAVNYGDNDLLPLDSNDIDSDGDTGESLPLDLDGNPRIYGTTVDCGAFEFQSDIDANRELPSLIVTTADDVVDLYDDQISLREAIYYAGSVAIDTTITFDASLNESTITLGGQSLWIDKTVTIDASSLNALTIDADGKDRVFAIVASTTAEVELNGLTITGGVAANGGGIFNSAALTLTNSTVSDNSASNDGGGIYNISGEVVLADSTVVSNTANRLAGGIYNNDVMSLLRSDVSRNIAAGSQSDAGGIHNTASGVLQLINSSLTGNSAPRHLSNGGGIRNEGDMTIVNSLLLSNYAYGTGAFYSVGTAVVINSTIAFNRNADHSAACYGSDITVQNSLIALNSGVATAGLLSAESSNNLISNDPVYTDSLFVTDPSPGVDGLWGTPDDDYGDLRLQYNSPGYNAGDNSLAIDIDGAPLNHDIRGQGHDRIVWGTVDIGAYERAELFLPKDDIVIALPQAVASLNPMQNDDWAPDAEISLFLLDLPANGSTVVNADNSVAYTPSIMSGVDSFTYKLVSGDDESGVIRVDIFVNTPPVANDDSYAIDEDGVLTVNVGTGLVFNDSDFDEDSLTAVLVDSPVNGQLAFNSDGSFTYAPNPHFFGADSFTYKANDGLVDSNIATVDITVNSVNDKPVATDNHYLAIDNETLDVPVEAGVLINDSDIEDSVLTALLIDGPANGQLELNLDGSFTYTPDAGFKGVDSFTYQASDGEDLSAVATVSIDVITTPIVSTLTDELDEDYSDGDLSLREAIYLASTGLVSNVITFDPSLFTDGVNPVPQTIILGGAELAINSNLEILGPGQTLLSVDANQLSRVFNIGPNTTVTLSDLSIIGGQATGASYSGGGIHNSGVLKLTNSTVSDNSGNSGNGGGGGVYNDFGTLTLIDSTVSGNSVNSGGGGIYNNSGTLTLTNSMVLGNSANGPNLFLAAGGIFNASGTMTLTNSMVLGNSANGRAIFFTAGGIANFATLTLTNSTVSGNLADADASASAFGVSGGISSMGTLTVNNTIVALNDALTSADIEGDFIAKSSLVGVDPGFVRNPWAGPDGEWGTDDDDYGDLRLTAGSLAVDAGDEALLPADTLDLDGDGDTAEPLPIDLAGNQRVIGEQVDIGAYESVVELVFQVSSVSPNYYITDWQNPVEVRLTRTLDMAVDYSQYIEILGPGGGIITPAAVEIVGGATLQITLPELAQVGQYTLNVSADLPDAEGGTLDQDEDGFAGEALDDTFTHSWQYNPEAFAVFTHYPSQGSLGSLNHTDIYFNRTIDPATFAVDDVALTSPLAVDSSPQSISPIAGSSGKGFRVNWNEPLGEIGQYTVNISADVNDPDGRPLSEGYTGRITISSSDLIVEDGMTVTGTTESGGSVTLDYSVRNVGLENASGDLVDAIYLSLDDQWNSSDPLLTIVEAAIDLPVGQTGIRQASFELPGVRPGTYHLIVRTDSHNGFPEMDESNNVRDLGTIQVTTPVLAAPGSAAGVLSADSPAAFYAIQVPAGEDLSLTLDASGGANSIYVGLNRVPSRQDRDYRSKSRTMSHAADAELIVPGGFSGGTYYVMVYAANTAAAIDYTLTAELTGLSLTDWTPAQFGNAADAIVTLTGTGFVPGTLVTLIDQDGAPIVPSWINVVSTQIIEIGIPAETTVGVYDLEIERPDSETVAISDAITITQAGEAILETNLIAPSSIRWFQHATIWVEYSNSGTIAMKAPLLVVSANSQGEEGALLRLNQFQWGYIGTSSYHPGLSHSIQILASGKTPGLLQPGESFRVPVYYAGWQQPGPSGSSINFTLGVLDADDTTPADWASMKDSLRPEDMPEQAWASIFDNFTAEVGATWGDYISMLSENATYLRRLGQTVTDASELMAFELAQAQGYPAVGTLAGGTDAAAVGPGLDISFSRSFSESIVSRYQIGTLGYGWTNNWDVSAVTRDDGKVEILYPSGAQHLFRPHIWYRDFYWSEPGDNGTLHARPDGGYLLREASGSAYAFDIDGKLEYVEETNGNRITCGYDGQGHLTTLSHSNAIATVTIAYNAAGLIESVTDQDGRATTYAYDAANEHLVGVTGYDGLGVGYTYDASHALTEIAYADATHTYYEYNPAGQLTAVYADGGAGRIDIARGEGGLVMMTDLLGGQSDLYFNQNGAIEKTVDPLDRAVEMDYDTLGNLTRMTDPLGRSTIWRYDTLGNITQSTNALGFSTRFTYTRAFNQLDLLIDAANNVMDYDYDVAGNLLSITYADSSLERWEYDTLGNAEEWINRRNQSVQYTFNAEGQVTGRQYGLDTPGDLTDDRTVAFTYDARGNLTQSDDETGTTTYTYDGDDYLMQIVYPGGRSLSYTYDSAGRRESMTDELGHETNYAYDSLGRLAQLTDETDAVVVTYSYDELSRLSRADKGNGTYTTYAYDAAGQLLDLINYAPDDSINSSFTYTYDDAGLRMSMTTLDGGWAYEYDAIGQLTHAVFTPAGGSSLPAKDLTYEYDALGNRIRTLIDGVETVYTSNELNQYETVGGVTYEYDADGNLISDGSSTYVYNTDNQLVMVTMPDATILEYVYDAMGNRVAVSVDGVVTEYVIDPIGLGNVVGEYNATGTQTALYTHGLGLVSQATAAGAFYYDFDALGSTVAMTAATGNALNTYAYLPFGGESQWAETVANYFQFVGQWGVMNDDSGLDYMRARYYSQSDGRFPAADPIGVLARVS